ncbi:hypothetical protein EMCRGX_G004493 [Ephydatia muelleri]
MASARIQRWALTLSAYNYQIVYRPSQLQANADGLSRLPLKGEEPGDVPLPGDTILMMESLSNVDSVVTATTIRSWTDKDPVLSLVRRMVLHDWQPQASDEFRPYEQRKLELSVQNGCVLWGSRVVVPPQGRQHVLEMLHEGHPGISRMKSLARGIVWWPKLDADQETLVRSCKACQENQKCCSKVQLHPWEWPAEPWARVHVDFFGPFLGKQFFIIVDAHSKWIDVCVVSSPSSQQAIQALRRVFSTHGLPQILVSDNGAAFSSSEFQTFVARNGFKHVRSAPYHPATNGLAERAVQTVKDALKKTSGDIDTRLSRFLFQYRLTPHSSTGQSPAKLLLGRVPRSHLDFLFPDVADNVKQNQQWQKQNHDQRATERFFVVGDKVYALNHRGTPTWLPGTVSAVSGSRSLTIKFSDGRESRYHADHVRAHEQDGRGGKEDEDEDDYSPTECIQDQEDETLLATDQNQAPPANTHREDTPPAPTPPPEEVHVHPQPASVEHLKNRGSSIHAILTLPLAGHLGIKRKIRERFTWKGLNTEVIQLVKSCEVCQRNSAKLAVGSTGLHPIPVVTTWHHVSIDFVGPISPISTSGNRYILTSSDQFSKWVEAVAVPTKEAHRVASALYKIFMQMGLPNVLTTDNGSEFRNKLNAAMLKKLGIRHSFITPYHPQSNGLDERLAHAPNTSNQMAQVAKERQEILKDVKHNIFAAQAKQKQHYDAKHTRAKLFDVGVQVLKKDFLRKKRKGGKLDSRWLGPYIITQKLSKGFYSLQSVANPSDCVKRVNGAHLKAFHSQEHMSNSQDLSQSSSPLSPRHSSQSTPSHSGHSSPHHLNQFSSQHSSQPSPIHSSQSTPQHSSQSTPQHFSQSTPQHSSQSTPQHSSQSTPQHSSQSIPQHSSQLSTINSTSGCPSNIIQVPLSCNDNETECSGVLQMEEIDCSILWEQLHSSHLMRLWRTGACVLHYKAAEDDEEFDETSLRLKEGEYALSKDITVCLWLEYRSLNGSTPLRDVSGGDFVIVNEELHREFDEFRSKVYAYVDKEYSIVEAVELLQVWCRATNSNTLSTESQDTGQYGSFK